MMLPVKYGLNDGAKIDSLSAVMVEFCVFDQEAHILRGHPGI